MGDAHVNDVNLQTCWLLGRQKALELIPEMFDEAELKDNIDFLLLFSTTLVNKCDEEDGSYDCSKLLKEYGPDDENTNETFHGDGDRSGFVSYVTTTLDGDLEDIIAEELPQGPK